MQEKTLNTTEPIIPYGRQWIDDDDIRNVVDVLEGDFLTTGPAVTNFELGLANYAGAQHAIAVNSGTAALHAAYYAAGLGPGDEIITSPLTFAATANAALYLGANVKFVDIQTDTGNLDPSLIQAAITEKTKLIVPVDFAGHPADYDQIRAIAEQHGLVVVADAAHSFGATYREQKVGKLADLTETSFHPVKPVTTAEGGAILTDNPDFALAASTFRTHGIIRDPKRMTNYEGPWSYEIQDLGFNYRLTDIQSALGISQLKKLDAFIQRRRAIAATYLQAFADVPELILPTPREYVESGWHLFVVRVKGNPAQRLPFFERLRELGLGVQVHYMPVYRHPYYQQLGFPQNSCPIADDYYSRAVSLPIFPKMTDDEVNQVIARVKRAVQDVLK